MVISRLYLYERCPLRKGADVLAIRKNPSGHVYGFSENIGEVISGERLTVRDIPINTGDMIIPEEEIFDICILSEYTQNGVQVIIPTQAARRVNYVIAVESGSGYEVGFFATLKGVDHADGGEVFIFNFERDTVNTAMQNGEVTAINGAVVLSAKIDCADVQNSGAITGAEPTPLPIPNGGSASIKTPAVTADYVRVMGLFTSSKGAQVGEGVGEIFWLQSEKIPYNGDSGINDFSQRVNFEKLYKNYEYLSTCTAVIRTDATAAARRVSLQKLYIVPAELTEDFDIIGGGETVRVLFDGEANSGDLPYNLFYQWTPQNGCYYNEIELQAPADWTSKDGRATYSRITLGSFSKRIELKAYEAKNGARLLYGLSGEDLFITLKVGANTIDLTPDFVAPILSNEAQQLLAAQGTSNAVSGLAAGVSVVTGVITGNPLAAIGGLLSGAQLLGNMATQKTTPYTIEADSRAFRTLYGLNGRRGGTCGGLYWERLQNANFSDLRTFEAAFGEKFSALPIIGIKDVFLNGTREKNCLYFKISGGLIDGALSSESGRKVLEAFQDGVRIWKDWQKMRAANYGS